MKIIPLPNKIYFAKETDNKSELVIEPLYPGYGVSIGNALRRVLLSSLPGAAVTAVKIKGVDHEFSTIPNATQDVVDVLLNLKQMRLRVHSEEPVRLELRAKGRKEVRAGDMKPNPLVEIVNPDLLIATLDNKAAELSMELIVEQGRGYVPVEMRESEKMEIGMIAIDAIFTPVRTVNFEVENVRVGQITNYDKLTITMETDGTMTGREAVDQASQILVDHFHLFLTKQIEEVKEEKAEEAKPEPGSEPAAVGTAEKQAAGSDLESLNLPNRAYNALVRNGITTAEQLQKMSREEFLALEGLGEKSINEILIRLGRMGKQ